MDTWATADFHFQHANIIKYCKRPFSSLEEMDLVLIKNFNNKVKKDDLVYHIGDFCFKNSPGGKKGEGGLNRANYYRSKLNGNFIFIRGNHDCNNGVKTAIERIVINFGGYRINLVHNPEHRSFNYELNIVGHVHNNWKIQRFKKDFRFTDCCNVGIDVWNYSPVKLTDVINFWIKWKRENQNAI